MLVPNHLLMHTVHLIVETEATISGEHKVYKDVLFQHCHHFHFWSVFFFLVLFIYIFQSSINSDIN